MRWYRVAAALDHGAALHAAIQRVKLDRALAERALRPA